MFQVRGPAALTPANDADLEVTIVDLGTNHVWDFMGVARTGATTFSATAYGDGDLDGTGFGYFPAGGGTRVRAGVRASGASWLGGLVTGENLRQGAIEHALAIAVGSNDLKAAFVPPAVEFDGNGASTYTGTLPMGTRLGHPARHPPPRRHVRPRQHDLRRPGDLWRLRHRPQHRLQPVRRRPHRAESVLIPVRRPLSSGAGIGPAEDRAPRADRGVREGGGMELDVMCSGGDLREVQRFAREWPRGWHQRASSSPRAAAPPTWPAAAAALATDGLDLSTGVAVAFPRSPMVTAQIAWELAARHRRALPPRASAPR